jgi:hypothetical protein
MRSARPPGLFLAASLLLAPAACTPDAPGAAGSTCIQSTDCADGLGCVMQKNGTSQCSTNLGPIQFTEDATAPKTADAAAADGATADGDDSSTAAVSDAPSAYPDAPTTRTDAGGGGTMPEASAVAETGAAPSDDAAAAGDASVD